MYERALIRISSEEIHGTLRSILLQFGFDNERANLCSRLFTETTRDGVYSHGLNRFPRFLETIKNGLVNVNAQPTLIASFGALERWDGNSGPGNLNAHASMSRAIALGGQYGIGCVALKNTNHWMRAGTYGWLAADAGYVGICWTNTLPNLPPWGGTTPALGNNPLVIAVPRSEGHIVLDMAMSQFSFGRLESYRKSGEQLPVAGGFSTSGSLTTDPSEIEASGRPLPIGYWKGSGLSLLLDCVASLLAEGNATFRIPTDVVKESGLSQVFIAIKIQHEDSDRLLTDILSFLHESGHSESPVRYPGERTLEIRKENLQLGVPVDAEVWNQIKSLIE